MLEKYQDEYTMSSIHKDLFLQELSEIQEGSQWLTCRGSDLAIRSVQPIEVLPILNSHPELQEDVLMDTASIEGTNLLLELDGQMHCLRNTGYSGLLQTAVGLSGPGIGRLWTHSAQMYCDCLNEFLRAQENTIQIYRSCDKISGVFSNNYQPMEIIDLMKRAEEALSEKMGTPVFSMGEMSHSLTSITWEFPEVEEDLMQAYADVVEGKSKMYGPNFTPIVKLTSSNTGFAAAALTPMFKAPGKEPFNIGSGVRIRHDGKRIGNATGSSLSEFSQQAGTVFAMYQDSFAVMEEMLKVAILHPQNAFISACNYCFGNRLPKKQASAALEEFNLLNGDEPCTMYDIYIGVTGVVNEAKRANLPLTRRTILSECVGKLLNSSWLDFDVAGNVAWINGKEVTN